MSKAIETYYDKILKWDYTDKFACIDTVIDFRGRLLQAVAIMDSVIEYGYTEEIHNKMMNDFLTDFEKPKP